MTLPTKDSHRVPSFDVDAKLLITVTRISLLN